MLDFVVVPVRWMMAQEIVNNYARKLAMCETLSQSYATMEADPSLKVLLQNIGGVGVKSIDLHVRISRTSTLKGETESYRQPARSYLGLVAHCRQPVDCFLELSCRYQPFCYQALICLFLE
jgi:hypothetical protein